MAHKALFNHTLILTLAMTALLLSVALVWPVRADGGIVLRPPFDGTYRVTAYFDHDRPTYCIGANNVITIYNGEGVSANCSTQTGEPYPYDGHDGWDWSMGTGTDVLAAAAGTVEVADDGNWGNGYGRTIVIDHENGYYTQYSHLDTLLVNEGEAVTAGQHIAESGATPPGTPAHLHFGVRHGGYGSTAYAVDPFGWRGSGRDPLFDYNSKESSCLWAGVPGDDISCADIIVEDDGEGWTESGTWFYGINGNGYREHHTYSWPYPPSSYAYWLPSLPAKGYYQIYAFVPPISSRTTHANYLVSGVSQETRIRDQSGAAPRWMSLGTFELPAGLYGWVRLHDYTGEPQESHWVAADSMKFSADIVYLPDVRNSGGWTSSIVIRNNSTSAAQVAINYYNTSGGWVSYQTTTIAGNGSATRTPTYGFTGSAVVVASEDVSVVVETKSGSGSSLKAEGYSGLSQGYTKAYFPTVGNRGWEWSEITVMNTSGETANVTMQFFDRNGNPMATQNRNLNPNGKSTVDLRWVGLPNGFLGSAYVSSNKSIVAETRTTFNSSPIDDTAAYEGLAPGSTGSLYFPQVKRRMFGGSWYDYSGIVIQNLDEGNSAGVYVYFYDRNGVLKTYFYDSIPPKSSHGYNTRYCSQGYCGQAPEWAISALGYSFNGSVRVMSTNDREIVGVCKTWIEGGVDAIEMYVGEDGGTSELIVPLVYRRTSNWRAYTGIIVQNLGGSTADVTVRFYRQNGSEVTGASFTDHIPSSSSHGYNTRYCSQGYCGQAPEWAISALGSDFIGSMRSVSTNGQPLIGVVDQGLETKAIYYYNAVQR